MPASATITVEVDEELKEKAAAIYAAEGVTISEAFRMFLVQTVTDHASDSRPFHPNAETVEAMMEGLRGESIKVGTIEDLMADLHADD